MKHLSLIGFAIITIMILTFSCKKNETVDPLFYSNNSTNLINSSIQEYFNEHKEESQFFTVDASQFQTIIGEKGMHFYLSPNSFIDNSGNPVNGNVQIELIEIMTKAEMIRSNKPTNYTGNPLDPSDDNLLVSGGEFYFNATQNGQQLTLIKSIYGRIPTNDPAFNMELFNGIESDNIGIEWSSIIDPSNVLVTSDSSNGGGGSWTPPFWYEFSFDQFGWTNVDHFLYSGNYQGQLVDLEVYLNGLDSMNFNNTVVFFAIQNENAVGQMWALNNANFGFEFPNIPVGTSIDVLAMSKINGDYYYSLTNTMISSNSPNIENLQMQAITLAQLNNIINNL